MRPVIKTIAIIELLIALLTMITITMIKNAPGAGQLLAILRFMRHGYSTG